MTKYVSNNLAFLAACVATLAPQAAMAQNLPIDNRVIEKFTTAYEGICSTLDPSGNFGTAEPAIHQLSFNYKGEVNQAPRPFRLYIFPCYTGAYNFSAVVFGANEYEEIKQMHFAIPEFNISYKGETDEIVKAIEVVGFTTHDAITNETFDPESQTFRSFSKWRGLGDASSTGIWEFQGERFVLLTYDVDASYNGEFDYVRVFGDGSPDQ